VGGGIGQSAADHPDGRNQNQDGDDKFGVRQAQFENAGLLLAGRFDEIHAQPFRQAEMRRRLKRMNRGNRENPVGIAAQGAKVLCPLRPFELLLLLPVHPSSRSPVAFGYMTKVTTAAQGVREI